MPHIPKGWKTDTFNLTVKWKTKKRGTKNFSFTVDPDFDLGYGKRITGWRRAIGAEYSIHRYGNRCVIASPFCIMGGKPFHNPIHADFDHINGDRLDHRAGNVRLACHPCNAYQQKFQRKSTEAPTSVEREREDPAHAHARSYRPSSREMAASIEQFPGAVRDAFHPMTGRLAKQGMSVLKKWYVNNLPDIVGLGRATTYGKYVDEFVEQGYLVEEPSQKGVKLVRTGKKADALLWRELGISSSDTLPQKEREETTT